MIIYEEEYRVQATKIAQWQENHLKFEKIMKNLDAPPFLKGWWVWQDRFTPGLIRCVWVVEELGDIERYGMNVGQDRSLMVSPWHGDFR